MKDLKTGKITDQHIENISEKVLMARESEVPLAECPEARLPFPLLEKPTSNHSDMSKVIPEGAADDNWVDDSFWLNSSIPEENSVRSDRPMPENPNRVTTRSRTRVTGV